MSHELFKKMVKEEIWINEQSGQMLTGDIVEIALRNLAIIDDPKINKNIEKYRSRKEEIINKMKDCEHDLKKLVDEVYKKLKEDL